MLELHNAPTMGYNELQCATISHPPKLSGREVGGSIIVDYCHCDLLSL